MPSKNLPILVLGYGSIAKRHVGNLLSLGYRNISVSDPDDRAFANWSPVKRIGPVTSACASEFRIAFICTPTNRHVKDALICARAGCDLFIEKPLSHTLLGVDALVRLAKRKKLVAMTACNYRFHPGFRLLEKAVRTKKFGAPLTARVVLGHDLSASRKGVDYRKTYAARAKTGGGVILDSGSHVVDYLQALFGPVKRVSAHAGNVSRLKIDAEDYALASLRHTSGVASSIELDFFSVPKRHVVEIQCERGRMTWDFPNDRVMLEDGTTKQLRTIRLYPNADADERRNDMFLRELRAFLKCVRSRTPGEGDLTSASSVVQTLEAMKRSAKKNTIVTL
ncbi:Gfo/Idh/MocA family oxidoreductase [Candidatus Uhrbacteria bacterium]|nr:Gfo/Idh/MocA family oxidoreductase [Candidatus Uhrbacteria bacterium]